MKYWSKHKLFITWKFDIYSGQSHICLYKSLWAPIDVYNDYIFEKSNGIANRELHCWPLVYLVWCSAWWRHEMETFCALVAFCEGNLPVTSGFPHKVQWRRARALILTLMCVRTNGWANGRVDGDFETPGGTPWRHCNEKPNAVYPQIPFCFVTHFYIQTSRIFLISIHQPR